MTVGVSLLFKPGRMLSSGLSLMMYSSAKVLQISVLQMRRQRAQAVAFGLGEIGPPAPGACAINSRDVSKYSGLRFMRASARFS